MAHQQLLREIVVVDDGKNGGQPGQGVTWVVAADDGPKKPRQQCCGQLLLTPVFAIIVVLSILVFMLFKLQSGFLKNDDWAIGWNTQTPY